MSADNVFVVAGMIEICSIIGIIAAGIGVFCAETDKERAFASKIGIASGAALLITVQIAHAMVGDRAKGPSVLFTSNQMQGRECKNMADEAHKVGANRWSCLK
jgi:hypothetical protein